MDPYIADWLNLLLRFVHLVTGIAWIGASFYFIWLDNHLRQPPQWKTDKGIKGDLWAIHGGGFYEVAKYQLAPATLPETLHWFKWEAYSTWISGFLLLSVMYYVGAQTYLIDPMVAELSQVEAIGIGLVAIFGGWFLYDLLCNSRLSSNVVLLGCLLLLLICGLSFGLSQVFSARGAYIHVGAVIGTIMVGNVFRVIIPSQKALVAAVQQGSSPDPTWAAKAKLRSTHNTYLTLPLLFIMISNHYPFTYNNESGWLVLMAIIVITAVTRRYFVLRHNDIKKPMILVAAGVATLVLAFLIAPARLSVGADIPDHAENLQLVANLEATVDNGLDPLDLHGQQIIQARCLSCHSDEPDDEVFKVAPLGVKFDTLAEINRWSQRIKARSVDTTDMPLLNKSQMTQQERVYLGAWLSGDKVAAMRIFKTMEAEVN